MTAPLRRVLLRGPATRGDWAGAGWRTPDPVGLERQHEAFCALLADLGARLEGAPALPGLAAAASRPAPLIASGRGAVPLRMAKPARREEPGHAAAELERL